MLPETHPELARVLQQTIRHDVDHIRLVNLALSRPKTHRTIEILARFGVWLVEQGEAIELRYSPPDAVKSN